MTSSLNGPRGEYRERLDGSNGFAERLKSLWKSPMDILLISSCPEDHRQSTAMRHLYSRIFRNENMPVGGFRVLDYTDTDANLNCGCVILSGGPTFRQGRFFRELGLKEKIRDYQGIILGISAGTMNSATLVYARPEEPEQLTDSQYERFYPGLGLTDKMILPHYQEEKNSLLAGKRLYEDITLPDSRGRAFYAFPDGTYLYISEGSEQICGEAYIIRDGAISRL